jgi:peptide/nickel transport system substrate-binding protein
MQTHKRGLTAVAGLAICATVATACGGSSSGGSGTTPGGTTPPSSNTGFSKLANNNTGTPVKGGTLNVLSSSDTDYLDPNVTYYALGYQFVEPYNRSLYTNNPTEGHQTDVVPDLATAAPQVSSDGKTVTITLRQGVFWNTSPKRAVVAADVVRGVKAACNPVQPMGGLPDFNFLILGYEKFCAGYGKAATAAAIASYANKTDLPGVVATDPQTVVFHLTQPAAYFPYMLALPTFSPRPKEYDAYIPGSTQLAQHTISDGAYTVQSYQPTKSITYVRNPVWDASTDPVHKAYVDKIFVDMTVTDRSIGLKRQQAGSPSADLCLLCVGPTDVPGLLSDPGLSVGSEIASNPYILFNDVSPNNNGALKKPEVRQALSYAISRAHLIQVAGGSRLNVPLSHVLPAQIHGSNDFDLYPYDPNKAKTLLQQAGASHLTLKFLYRPTSTTTTKMFQVLQQDLGKVGVTLKGEGVPDADFYTKYLQKPDSARGGQWDLSAAGWGPDWYGDAALSFFAPLFDGRILPPASSDFGLFNDPTTNACIDKAKAATTSDEANTDWAECDQDVMKAAAFYPITNPNLPLYHPPFVHNDIYMPVYEGYDWTVIWLDANKNGG